MRSFPTLADFAAAQGEHLGYSDWREVTHRQIDMFADATGDRQWIHVQLPSARQRVVSVARSHTVT